MLAGGAGTRLRPITYTRAKQLVPVANKPILFYGLEDLARAGIDEVGVIVGSTADEIREALGDGSDFGLEITYIPQDEPLGLAHCVLIARDFLGDDDFVMYLGDNLLRHGIADFVNGFVAEREAGSHRAATAQILLARVDDPQRFGVASFAADGSVDGLVEKPENPPSELALVGVYLFDKTIHEAVRAIEPSPRGELEITDAIQWLIDQGHRVRHEELDGWWKDTGMLDPLLDGNRLVLEAMDGSIEGEVDEASQLEGRVQVDKTAQVIRSHIRGPAIIGPGAVIRDSYIGPFTSVGPACQVIDAEVEHSILLQGCRVESAGRITDSLIGRDATVIRSPTRPEANRLMLGDNSRVEIK